MARFPKRAVLRFRIEELEQEAESPSVEWSAILDKPATFPAADLGQPGGPAQLDGNGKVSASELPPLEHEAGEAANEAAMLALDVNAPAICIRTDFTPAHVFYLSADPASTLANWHDTGAFSSAAAAPSATVGPAATNGVAATYMRSDAAPAIDLTAGYAWSGVHAFSSSPTVPVPSGGTEVANKNYVDAQIIAGTTGFVDLTTNQSIAGVKTFSASPVVPTPTTDMQAATKAYVDGVASSGTYTPDLTATTNNTAPAALGDWMYSQTGKKVDVSGTIDITAVAQGDIEVGISLPVALTTSSSFQIAGTAAGIANGTTVDCYGTVTATTAPDLNRARLLMNIPDTAERYVTVQFSYVLP